jgi:hypothetical protein
MIDNFFLSDRDFSHNQFTWTAYETECLTMNAARKLYTKLNLYNVVKPMSFDLMTILINKIAKCLIVCMVIEVRVESARKQE